MSEPTELSSLCAVFRIRLSMPTCEPIAAALSAVLEPPVPAAALAAAAAEAVQIDSVR